MSGEPHRETALASPPEPVDAAGLRTGMWIFLVTELFMFGTLFIVFAVYLGRFPYEFGRASAGLERWAGAGNTLILLTSSLTVALSLSSLARGDRRRARFFLLVTVLFAGAFLGVKGFEWRGKILHGIYPGGAALDRLPPGQVLFYGLYFVMTGLHALHVAGGVVVLLWATKRLSDGRLSPTCPAFLANAGLYWHFVDVVWIYLFPLFYLLGT